MKTETGLACLESLLGPKSGDTASEAYLDLLGWGSKLRDIEQAATRFLVLSSDERSQRERILRELDRLALSHAGVSFAQLCALPLVPVGSHVRRVGSGPMPPSPASLKAAPVMLHPNTSPRPRTFLSYSQHEPAHSERVLALAHALIEDGIDVELDRFHQHEVMNWPRWCEERLRPENSDFVLMICSSEYRHRLENRVAFDAGRGVFWEGEIITSYLYRAKANERFIPILLDNETEESLPPIFANWTHFRTAAFGCKHGGDAGYIGLCRLLMTQPATPKPPLGDPAYFTPVPPPDLGPAPPANLC